MLTLKSASTETLVEERDLITKHLNDQVFSDRIAKSMKVRRQNIDAELTRREAEARTA